MASSDLAYGSLYGPVLEYEEAEADRLSVGSLYGPVLGTPPPAAPAGTHRLVGATWC